MKLADWGPLSYFFIHFYGNYLVVTFIIWVLFYIVDYLMAYLMWNARKDGILMGAIAEDSVLKDEVERLEKRRKELIDKFKQEAQRITQTNDTGVTLSRIYQDYRNTTQEYRILQRSREVTKAFMKSIPRDTAAHQTLNAFQRKFVLMAGFLPGVALLTLANDLVHMLFKPPEDDEPKLFGEYFNLLKRMRMETDGISNKMEQVQSECKTVVERLAASLDEIRRIILAKEFNRKNENVKKALSTYRQLSLTLSKVMASLSDTIIYENAQLLKDVTNVWTTARELTSEEYTKHLEDDFRKDARLEHAKLQRVNPSNIIKTFKTP